MNTKLLLLLVLLVAGINLKAQQLADFTLARESAFIYNPAITGTEEKNVFLLSGRKVWTKIKGSPTTINLAYHMPIENKNIGIGAYFINDFTGPTSFTGVNLSFAYHIVFREYNPGVSERQILSFGLSLSGIQYRINGSGLKLDQPDDNAIFVYRGSQFYPDAAFGVFYKSKKVEAGLSIPQLLHLDVPVNARQTGEQSSLRKMQHYNAYFTYKFDLNPKRMNNRKHYLEPSVNIHYVINAPFQGLATLRYNYDNIFFTEVGYRSLSTIFLGAGFTISKQFSFAYAYDFNVNNVRTDLGSVHEIQLKYVFDKYTFKKR